MDISNNLLSEMKNIFEQIDINNKDELKKYFLSINLIIESLVEENTNLKKKMSNIEENLSQNIKEQQKSKVGPKRQTKVDLKEHNNSINIDSYKCDDTHLFLIYDEINSLKISLDDIPRVLVLIENLKITKDDFSYIEKIVNEGESDLTETNVNIDDFNEQQLHNYFIINKDKLNDIFSDIDEKKIKLYFKKIGGSFGRGNLKNKTKIIEKFKEYLEQTNSVDCYLLSFKKSSDIMEIKQKLEFKLSLKNDSYQKNDDPSEDEIVLEISDISSKTKLCSKDLRLCHDSWNNPNSVNSGETILTHYNVYSNIDNKHLGQVRKVISEVDAPLENHVNNQKFIVCRNIKYNDIDYFVCVITGQCIKLEDYKVNQPSLINENIYITNNQDNPKLSKTDNGLNFEDIDDTSVNYIIGKEVFDNEKNLHIIDIFKNPDKTYSTYVLKRGSNDLYRKKSIQLKRQGRNYVKV